MTETPGTAAYRRARDLLLAKRDDYTAAVASFSWPTFSGAFNWATDWFDQIASGNDQLALWLVEEDGSEQKYTYADLAHRSDQLATWLAGQGVDRGHRVLLILGNQVELWESMLAIMKLGAVIVPTTTVLGAADLADRIDRGGVGHVIANATDTAKFADVPGAYTRISVGDAPQGWLSYADAYATTDVQPRQAVTAPDDTLLLYFTSGTTSQPKLVEHTQVSYPVGHLTTMYWLGLEPGDVHLNVSSPGWAKHAWSSFFAPLIAEATIVVYNYARFDAKAMLEQMRRCGVTSLCAPPTVWRMLIQADLSGGPGALHKVAAAGEPLNPEVIEQVRTALEPHHPRRLRTDGDLGPDRQHARPGSQAGIDGTPAARNAGGAGRSGDRRGRRRGRDLPRPVPAPGQSDGGLPRRPTAQRRGDSGWVLPHRRPRGPRCGGVHHLHRADRRCVQGLRLQGFAVRARKRAAGAPCGRRGRSCTGA